VISISLREAGFMPAFFCRDHLAVVPL